MKIMDNLVEEFNILNILIDNQVSKKIQEFKKDILDYHEWIKELEFKFSQIEAEGYLIRKELFIAVMTAIETQTGKDAYVEILLNKLRTIMNDEDNWINYFVYELKFGKENDRLKAYDKNKVDIPMSTAEDLYNCLIKNKRMNELLELDGKTVKVKFKITKGQLKVSL